MKMLDVLNYEGLYKISDIGEIWRVPRLDHLGRRISARKVKLAHHNKGYLDVSLFKDGKRTHHLVHRLVLQSFIGDCELLVDHINGNKQDNRLENLEYVTCRENIRRGFSRKKTSSKYRNVSWSRSQKRWIANIRVCGKLIHLGSFIDEKEAFHSVIRYEKQNQIA